MKPSEIQAAAVAALEAASWFTTAPAVPIISADGTEDDAVENALNGVGFAVIVSPVMAGKPISGGNGVGLVVVRSEFWVRVACNPKANTADTTGADRDTVEAVEKVISTLNALPYAAGETRIELDGDGFEIVANDVGLLAYDIKFAKRCVIP